MYRVRPGKAQHIWPPSNSGTSIDLPDGTNDEKPISRKSSIAKQEEPDISGPRKQSGDLTKKSKDLSSTSKNPREPSTPTNDINDSPPNSKKPTTPIDKKDPAFRFKHAQLKFQEQSLLDKGIQRQFSKSKETPAIKKEPIKPNLRRADSTEENEELSSKVENPALKKGINTKTKPSTNNTEAGKPPFKRTESTQEREAAGRKTEVKNSPLNGVEKSKPKEPPNKTILEKPTFKRSESAREKDAPSSKKEPENTSLKKVENSKLSETPNKTTLENPRFKRTQSTQEREPPSSKKELQTPVLKKVENSKVKEPQNKANFEKPPLKKVEKTEEIPIRKAEPETPILKKVEKVKELPPTGKSETGKSILKKGAKVIINGNIPTDKVEPEKITLKKVEKVNGPPIPKKSDLETPVLKKVGKGEEVATPQPDSAKPPLKKVETPKPKEPSINKPDWTKVSLKKVDNNKKSELLKTPDINSNSETDSKVLRSQDSKVDKMAATDCNWKRDAFRKQNRWSQSIENISPPESPTPQTPQPIPPPPSDGKDKLNKKPSVVLKEPVKKKSVRISKELPEVKDDKTKTPTEKSSKTNKKLSNAEENEGPPPPPPPPSLKSNRVPPPPPPMPGMKQPVNKELTKARNILVDQIKKATRMRPDWKTLMKDLEGGVKLKHVKSEDKLDRSSPILPENRGKGGKFLYDSEKRSPEQVQLLSEIQRGVKLRRVRTNDRSRPDFQRLGLKKLRRQMTADEKKSIPPDAPEALPSSSDEEEDIDLMRDDLKATKSQLADEIKKTKQMEREGKIQQIDLDSYRAECKKLKRQLKEAGVHEVKPIRNCDAASMAPKLSKSMSKLRMREEEMDFTDLDVIDDEIKSLQDQIDAQVKRAEKAESKCDELSQKMIYINNSSDEWELRSVYYEKKYKAMQKEQGIELPNINCIAVQTDPIEIMSPTCTSYGQPFFTKTSASRKSLGLINKMQSFKEEDEESEEESTEESESESEEESSEESSELEQQSQKLGEEKEEKRIERDINVWQNRIAQIKEKERVSRQERKLLREKVLKYYKDMRKERKEYLKVKEELDDMAETLKEANENFSEDDDESGSEESDESVTDPEDWWVDEPKKKPKKLKKKKRKVQAEKENLAEENLTDMSSLGNPEWSDSSMEESDTDDEDDSLSDRVRKMQARATTHEQKLNTLKKESHELKSKVTRCDEMFNEERRRHARFDNELQMLLSAID